MVCSWHAHGNCPTTDPGFYQKFSQLGVHLRREAHFHLKIEAVMKSRKYLLVLIVHTSCKTSLRQEKENLLAFFTQNGVFDANGGAENII